MHPIQKDLIRRLIQKNGLNYATLTLDYTFHDNVVFHLKQLIKLGFVSKIENKYFLTSAGLAFSGTFELQNLEDRKFKNTYIGFIFKLNGEFLIRSKSFQNKYFYKLIGGKPFFGESMKDARNRLFLNETNLQVPDSCFIYNSTHFKIQKTSNDKVLFDDALIMYEIKLPHEFDLSILLPRTGNIWQTKEQISNLKDIWPEIKICILNQNWKPILEYEFISDYALPDEVV